jgi:four helix bundle protein
MAYFETLNVWQQAKQLTRYVYEMTQNISDWGFRDQIQRASVSIMNNIAEGSESGSDPSYVRYLYHSKGSCAEVRSMLYLSIDFNYCTVERGNEMIALCKMISAGLNRMINHIKQQQAPELSME